MKSLRIHGQGTDRTTTRGRNGSRLDTIQAAVLSKLNRFSDEIDARNRVAQRYKDGSGDVARCAHSHGMTSVWAQYTIRLSRQRTGSARAQGQGHPHRDLLPQASAPPGAYRHFPVVDGGLPVSDALAQEVISLPMHAYLDEPTQDRIINTVRNELGRN